jgi:hypothetical protein
MWIRFRVAAAQTGDFLILKEKRVHRALSGQVPAALCGASREEKRRKSLVSNELISGAFWGIPKGQRRFRTHLITGKTSITGQTLADYSKLARQRAMELIGLRQNNPQQAGGTETPSLGQMNICGRQMQGIGISIRKRAPAHSLENSRSHQAEALYKIFALRPVLADEFQALRPKRRRKAPGIESAPVMAPQKWRPFSLRQKKTGSFLQSSRM